MRRIRFGPVGQTAGAAELAAPAWLIGPALSAGRQAAQVVVRQWQADAAVAEALAPRRTRLLLVAGVLLDLLVGDVLRRAGESPPCPSEGTTWVLPSVSLTTGVRCCYQPEAAAGAAVLYVSGAEELVLPSPADLPYLIGVAGPDGTESATHRLRLRFLGWDSGGFVRLDANGVLRATLERLAAVVADKVHRPFHARLGMEPGDPFRHLANRLVLDYALQELLGSGALDSYDTETVRRMVWTGPDWALASDASDTVAAAR